MYLIAYLNNTISSTDTTTSSNTHEASVDGKLHTTKLTSTPPLTSTEAVLARRVYALSVLLGGVTILRKGEVDIVASSRVGIINRSSSQHKDNGPFAGTVRCFLLCSFPLLE